MVHEFMATLKLIKKLTCFLTERLDGSIRLNGKGQTVRRQAFPKAHQHFRLMAHLALNLSQSPGRLGSTPRHVMSIDVDNRPSSRCFYSGFAHLHLLRF
jgi:hypothetical protein